MTTIADLLEGEELEKLAQSNINVGDVFLVNMTRKTGLVPKRGDESRNKFFVILGFDENGNAYGGVVVNSMINQRITLAAQMLHMPISKEKYNFLSHNSFVDCSRLMVVKKEQVASWKYLGQIEDNDVELITGAIKSSPLENKDRLALYGIK